MATEESNGVGRATSATPSWFLKQPHMAHIAAPVGPETFYPHREDLEQLVARAAPNDERSAAELRIDEILSQFRSTVSYIEPPKPEENFCRHNLDAYVRAIVDSIDDRHCSSIEAKAVQRNISLCIGPDGTSPEPVVIFKPNGSTVGLIATEAKALFTAIFACCAQAIQMAADLAMWLCHVYPNAITHSTVIVPFILCSWEHFQIGCVYLMPPCYPCAVLLTGALSVAVPSERRQIARWGIALAEHCTMLVERIKAKYTTATASKSDVGSRDLKRKRTDISSQSFSNISASNDLFYKPIACSNHPRAALVRIMSVFYQLQHYGSAECRDAVCFPEGVVGLPANGEDYQSNLFDFIMRKWVMYLNKKQLVLDVDDQGIPCGYSLGHPFIVYQYLDRSWISASALRGDHYNEGQREAFVSALTAVLGLFISAGVVHMDLRLPNIFFKFDDADTVHIKVIDWDDALLFGDKIPLVLQHDLDVKVASADCHAGMLKDLRNMLGLEL